MIVLLHTGIQKIKRDFQNQILLPCLSKTNCLFLSVIDLIISVD